MMRTCLIAVTAAALATACGKTSTEHPKPTPPANETEPPAKAANTAAALDVQLPNAREIDGNLLGGQPGDAALAAAAGAGYKLVINMRTEGEPGVAGERAKVEALGMKYLWLPIAGTQGLTEANARALDEALAGAGGKAIVHCASGNRVGALFALREHVVRGAAPADALAFGKRAGMTRLAAAVAGILGVE